MPGRGGYDFLEQHGATRQHQVANQKRDWPSSVLGRRLLQQRDQRQQNNDRAGVSNLPFMMPAIGFVRIHARGRITYRFSLQGMAEWVGSEHLSRFQLGTSHRNDTKGRRSRFEVRRREVWAWEHRGLISAP